ncbi:hypothetical protein PhCBS80983_g03038 [Powellomyces hirtus]|uniref:histidine kinase n=1 Tax=Powellomyces hirtus TaxID=109895 RepID=A0A507E439_9FUNG|nr:hypothetical protein PhCBS80983_g03038 [Powellomyces hirtus]
MALFAVLLTLASVGIMAIVSWLTTQQLLSDQLNQRMHTIALLRAQHVSESVTNLFADLQLINSRVLIQTYLRLINTGKPLSSEQEAVGNDDLHRSVTTYKSMIYTEFTSRNGTKIFSTAVPDATVDQLRLDKHTVFEDTIQLPAQRPDGTFAWGLMSPVRDSNNASVLLGTIYMILRTSELDQILRDTGQLSLQCCSLVLIIEINPFRQTPAGLGDSGQLALVTPVNTTAFKFVLPPVRNPELYLIHHLYTEDLAVELAITTNTSGVLVAPSVIGAAAMTAYQPLVHNWLLLAIISEKEINAPIIRLRSLLLYAILIVVLATLIVSLLAARLIVLPIRKLRALALEFSAGDLEVRSPIRKQVFPDEIMELNLAFNTMAQQLSSQYDSLDNKVKERTQALEAAKVEADQANAAKSSFLANITHELRTPLNGIIGLSALLAETPLNPDQKDLIASIRDCSDGLLIIVNDVLDFSKIEAGKLQLEKRPFDLFQCIDNSLYLLHLKAAEKGLLLSHKIAPNAPKCVEGDVVRLRQVLINLVGNSVKFTAEGSVVVTVAWSQLPTEGKFELQFEVMDTGIGIPIDAINRLFQSFSQVDSSTTRKYGGTGLGLAICKQLVEMMGGRIWVTSEPGKGSKFCFTILANAADPVAMKKPGADAMFQDLGQKYPMRILLAEDNAVNIKLAVRMLDRLGYECTVVNNGQEAVQAAKKDHYDMVLMDMQMPVMNGLEATEQIRAEKTILLQPVIIALTANAMQTDRDKCMQAGMDSHLSKPIKIEVMAEALESWGAKIAANKTAHRTNQRMSTESMRRICSSREGGFFGKQPNM